MTNLYRVRRQKNIRQHEVAEAVGIAVSTYCMYETGQRAVDKEIAEKIAKFFGVPLAEIFLPSAFTVSKLCCDVLHSENEGGSPIDG